MHCHGPVRARPGSVRRRPTWKVLCVTFRGACVAGGLASPPASRTRPLAVRCLVLDLLRLACYPVPLRLPALGSLVDLLIDMAPREPGVRVRSCVLTRCTKLYGKNAAFAIFLVRRGEMPRCCRSAGSIENCFFSMFYEGNKELRDVCGRMH